MPFSSQISKFVLGVSVLALVACGGGGSDAPISVAPPPAPVPAPTPAPPAPAPTPTPTPTPTPPPPSGATKTASTMETEAHVADFLALASFGSNSGQQLALKETDAADWLTAQFEMAPTLYLHKLQSRFESGEEIDQTEHRSNFWNAMVESPDSLRQRMVFALSQILVVSDMDMGSVPLTMSHYMDVLSKNAFGNYRDLLDEVTYSPAMANYLTYIRNRKGDPETGRMPDENYAREIMQLFSIGLVELNMDGSPKTDGNGKPIETYTNDDIMGLAKVFTGLAYKGGGFWDRDADAAYSRLEAYPDKHSELEKSFLGKTIPAGTGPEASIEAALDHIFDHPNVAPFLSRQLIQRFTMSSPTPDYIERVAKVFESGHFTAPNDVVFGTGERGDLEATLAAILLDESVLPGTVRTREQGKVREPILRWVHWARAFNVDQVHASNEWTLLYSDSSKRFSQRPFGSPSVFNFYRPGFVAPGTETGKSGLTAPEFQIVHEGAATGYVNLMSDFIRDQSDAVNPDWKTFSPDYSYELSIVDDPEALINHLDNLLLAGRMQAATRERIGLVLDEMPIRYDTEHTEEDKFARVAVSITMTVTDPAYTIQY